MTAIRALTTIAIPTSVATPSTTALACVMQVRWIGSAVTPSPFARGCSFACATLTRKVPHSAGQMSAARHLWNVLRMLTAPRAPDVLRHAAKKASIYPYTMIIRLKKDALTVSHRVRPRPENKNEDSFLPFVLHIFNQKGHPKGETQLIACISSRKGLLRMAN